MSNDDSGKGRGFSPELAERLHGLANVSLDAVVGMDAAGVITIWNDHASSVFGWSRDEALGRLLADTIIPPHLRAAHSAGVRRFSAAKPGPMLNAPVEMRAVHRDGHELAIELAIAPVVHDGEVTFCAFIRDIGARELRQREQSWRGCVLRMLADGIALGRILHYLAQEFEKSCPGTLAAIAMHDGGERLLLGAASGLMQLYESLPEEAGVGPGLCMLGDIERLGGRGVVPDLGADPHWGRHGAQVAGAGLKACWLEPALGQTGRLFGCCVLFQREAGVPNARRLELGASIAALAGIAIERRFAEAEKKHADEIIWKQANYDAVTGLPNRRRFRERLELDIGQARRAGGRAALLFIDLDHFKEANDTLGHDLGDTLLAEAARRIGECVLAGDTVARLGGDEFAVILAALDRPDRVEQCAWCILQRLREPFLVGGELVYLSASIGVTLYPEHADAPEGLLRNADQAMYMAKREGRNRFCHFTTELQEQASSRLRLARDLHGALAGGQFQVHFQPIVELASGQVRKAEALLRWNHPRRGAVSPVEFIPVAEETGMINEIGDWVFCQSVEWAERWSALLRRPFEVSVNKSPIQFLNQAAHISWPDYLRQKGVAGACVTVEITEGLLLNPGPVVMLQLQQYREAGIRVAIDDFGTGYSSMAYLRKFRIDYLKIDRSFVRDMCEAAGDGAIVEAIIAMAHKLGLKVIAEGVETEGQRAQLAAAGCDFGQGFLFSPAVPPADLERMLLEK